LLVADEAGALVADARVGAAAVGAGVGGLVASTGCEVAVAWLPAGRGVLVGVGVAVAAPELQEIRIGPSAMAQTISSQGQAIRKVRSLMLYF
jgi:hypothetical protein